MPEFVTEARRRYPDHRFIGGNIADVEDNEFDVVVLAGVLSSVPNPKQVLADASKRTSNQIIFDVTIHDRVRKGFEGLNMWSISEANTMAEKIGLSEIKMYDEGNVWVILSGKLV